MKHNCNKMDFQSRYGTALNRIWFQRYDHFKPKLIFLKKLRSLKKNSFVTLLTIEKLCTSLHL